MYYNKKYDFISLFITIVNPKHSIFYRPQLKEDAQLVYFYQQKIAMADACKEKLALSVAEHRKMGEIFGYPKKSIDYWCHEKQIFCIDYH